MISSREKIFNLRDWRSRPPPNAFEAQGNVRYTLKTPYRDGTTHIILEPLDVIARLAALAL